MLSYYGAVALAVKSPHLLINPLLVKDQARVLGEEGEDVKLLFDQRDLRLPQPDSPVGVVDDQLPVKTHLGGNRPAAVPAQMGLHLRPQYVNGEGLYNVLVAPGGKPTQLVTVLHPGGQKQDWARDIPPDAPAHLQPIHIRHTHVQQDQIRPPGGQGDRFLTAIRSQDLVSGPAEVAGQHVSDILFIVSDQEF